MSDNTTTTNEAHTESGGDFVALLGTKGGPAIRPGSAMPTSSLLQIDGRRIVVDCGLGVARGLVNQQMPLRELELIFITHLHSDHYLELGPLIHTAWTSGLNTPVRIFGPAGLESYWQHFLESMRADIELRVADEGRPDLASLISIHTLDAGEVLVDGTIKVDAMRNTHPPLVDTFSLSFQGAHSRVVFSGDTAPMDALADWATGCDLLIHEAMLEAALPALFKRVGNGDDRLKHHWMRSHSLAHDAAQLATKAKVGALALHHLIPSDDPNYGEEHWQQAVDGHWDGPLHVGRDGLVIPLNTKR